MLKNLLKHLKDSTGLRGKGSRSDTGSESTKINFKAMSGDYAGHIESTQKEIRELREDMDARGTKEELAKTVETKFVQKMGEMISQLADKFAGKDLFTKKVFSLEKNVSHSPYSGN
jgi:hypothetical protein